MKTRDSFRLCSGRPSPAFLSEQGNNSFLSTTSQNGISSPALWRNVKTQISFIPFSSLSLPQAAADEQMSFLLLLLPLSWSWRDGEAFKYFEWGPDVTLAHTHTEIRNVGRDVLRVQKQMISCKEALWCFSCYMYIPYASRVETLLRCIIWLQHQVDTERVGRGSPSEMQRFQWMSRTGGRQQQQRCINPTDNNNWKKNSVWGVEGKRESVVSPPEGIIIINPLVCTVHICCWPVLFFFFVCTSHFLMPPRCIYYLAGTSIHSSRKSDSRDLVITSRKTSAGLRASSLARISTRIRAEYIYTVFFFIVIIIITISFRPLPSMRNFCVLQQAHYREELAIFGQHKSPTRGHQNMGIIRMASGNCAAKMEKFIKKFKPFGSRVDIRKSAHPIYIDVCACKRRRKKEEEEEEKTIQAVAEKIKTETF